ADRRADAAVLFLDRIERIEARGLDVELGSGVAVERTQRTLGLRIPFAVGRTAQAADALEFVLHRLAEVDLRRRSRRQRGDIRLLGIGLLRRRRRRARSRGRCRNDSIIARGGPAARLRLGGDPLALGIGGLVERHLFGLLGGDPGLFRRLGLLFGGFQLLRGLRALGDEPRALLFGQPRLFGR